VRPDLADLRLASKVFAPHYAKAVPAKLIATAILLATPDLDGPVLAELAAGDAFELLDRSGGFAWGIAVAAGTVGYLPDAAVVTA